MTRRILSIFLSLALLCTLFPQVSLSAAAETYSGSCGDNLNWSLDTETGLLTITGSGAMADYNVSTSPWYSNRESILSVSLPDGITSIGKYAFSGCKNLVSVAIPEGVSCIKESTFSTCYGLSSVDIPSTVRTIEDMAFYGCTHLLSVTIPEGVVSIGRAFDSCDLLASVSLPNTLTVIGARAFENCKSLTSVTIPSSVISIGNYAFYSCTTLNNVTIMEGVTSIGENAFLGCKKLTAVEIPASVSNIGSAAFNTEIGTLKIYNPDCQISANKNTLGKPGGTFLYGFQGSTTESYASTYGYSFRELPTDNLAVKLMDPEGTVYTSGFTVRWYEKGSDTVFWIGRVLYGADEEKEYEFEILLGEELSCSYRQPERQEAVRAGNSNELVVLLEPIGTLTVSGRVVDQEGEALNGAAVVLRQSFNGQYVRELPVELDEDASFSAVIRNVPTLIEIVAEGCYTRINTVISEETDEAEIALGNLNLTRLPENKITLELWKTAAAYPGEEWLRSQIFSTNGLSFTLYNQTQGKEITDFLVQDPYLILAEGEAAENDTLLVSTADGSGQMSAAQTAVTLDNQMMGVCVIEFVENGKFALGALSGCEAGTVMLFDSGSQWVRSATVGSNYLSEALPAGTYTAVFLKKTELLRSVSCLERLADFGLTEGADYLTKTVSIANGRITDLGAVNIPELDESRLYFTVPEQTGFSASLSTAMVGRYVILRCAYEIDERYPAEQEAVMIELPEGTAVVNGSLTLDGARHAFASDGNILTVATNRRAGIIRFYAVATSIGTKEFNASLSFQSGQSGVVQPIGTASFTAEAGKFVVPGKTGQTAVTVSGTTLARSRVTVYDNGTAVGTAEAGANGSWKLRFELIKPYSFSYHDLYAEIENSTLDSTIKTDVQTLIYEKNSIEVSKVTMINQAHPAGSIHPCEYHTVFDFLDPNLAAPYYRYWPAYPGFSFQVEFTGGDDTIITEVYVVTKNDLGEATYIPCAYDPATGLWLGTHQYVSANELPANVNVMFRLSLDYEGEIYFDEERFSDELNAYVEWLNDAGVDFTTTYSFSATQNDNVTTIEATPKNEGEPPVNINDTGGPRPPMDPNDSKQDQDKLRNQGYNEYSSPDGTTVFISDEDDSSVIIYTFPPVEDDATPVTPTMDEFTLTIDLDPNSELGRIGLRDLYGNDPYSLTLDLAEIGGIFYPPLGLAMGLSNIIQNYGTYHDILRMISSNYRQFIDAEETGVKLLLRKCSDGAYALTSEQMSDFKNRLWSLLDEYDTKKTFIVRALENSYYLFLGLGTVLQTVGSAMETAAGSIGTGAVEYTVGKLGTYAFLRAGLAGRQLDKEMLQKLSEIYNDIFAAYRCPVEPGPGDQTPGSVMAHPAGMSAVVNHDPSGYVYEAVPSNRLEGVRAEAYVYDYEYDEFGMPSETRTDVFWNAEDYDQVNPLYTNLNGEYAWDVPVGQWLVKFSKEGYYDADSRSLPETDEEGYLPVPPPQTEVNVGMISKAGPTLESVNSFHDAVRITFSQYMQIDTVNPSTVTVEAGGAAISGTLTPVNAEYDYEQLHQYASIFLFAPDEALSGMVSVTVSGAVNYAGTPMRSTVTQSAAAEIRPETLVAADELRVSYNSGALLELTVEPAGAGQNAELEVISWSPSIVGIANEKVSTDGNGRANIMVLGKLPGQAEITVALKGTELQKTVRVTVSGVENVDNRCEKVTASIASGSTVVSGTLLELSTATEGAEIYYTLDGTCPCTLDSPSRIKYTEPIRLTEDSFIIAYAVKEGMTESYTAGFMYFVSQFQNPFSDVPAGSWYEKAVLWAVQNGITSGTGDGMFSPKGTCKREQVVTFLYAAEGKPGHEAAESPFTDVKPGKYYYHSVMWAVENKVTGGVSDSLFGVGRPCTREQVVSFLWKAAGNPQPEGTESPFADVVPGKYYYKAVLWAVENGVTSGVSATSFGVGKTCTRAQIVTFLYQVYANQ